jgi:hypothetical protein
MNRNDDISLIGDDDVFFGFFFLFSFFLSLSCVCVCAACVCAKIDIRLLPAAVELKGSILMRAIPLLQCALPENVQMEEGMNIRPLTTATTQVTRDVVVGVTY